MATINNDNIVDLNKIHCGYAAQKKLTQNAGRTAKKKAYNDAMRMFQDRYYEQVGIVNAQLRFGPRRTRMSRAEWITTKKHAELLSNTVNGYRYENITLKQKLKKLIAYTKNIFSKTKEKDKITNKKEINNYE